MSKEKVNTFKLGLFVTVAVLLFVAAVYYIGNEQHLFQPTFRLSAMFHNAQGLKPGNNVRYAGIDAGTVQGIVIVSDSMLRVDMALQRGMQAYIKTDAVASIGADGLVGNKIVNINPALNGAAPAVEDGDVIRSYSLPAAEDMMATLGATNEHIAQFSEQLLEIAEKINGGAGTVNLLLEDAALAGDLRQAVANLKYTTAAVRQMGTDMGQIVAGIQEGEGLLHGLLYDTTVLADMRSVSGHLNRITAQRVEPLLTNLQAAAENMAQSSAGLQDLLNDIHSGNGALGALLRDANVDQDLRQSLTNIRLGTERLNENLEAMRHNFLFRGYFKKLDKQERKSLKR